MNSGSLFDNATGSQRRKIYLIEILNLDIEEKQEVEEDSIQSLLAMDQSVNDLSQEASGVTGKTVFIVIFISKRIVPMIKFNFDLIYFNQIIHSTIFLQI